MRRSHFSKAKPSYPRYQPIVTQLKPVPEEPAFYISKVTVRAFSETRIIELYLIRGASRRNPLKLSAKAMHEGMLDVLFVFFFYRFSLLETGERLARKR